MKQKIEFASHPANLSLLRTIVREFISDFGFPQKQIELIVLGVDEACTNVIRHVYKHEETHLIQLSCERFERGIRFRLRDYGPQAQKEMCGRQLDAVQPGGLGLHLIKAAFDKVDYVLKKTGTELIMTKLLPAKMNARAHAS